MRTVAVVAAILMLAALAYAAEFAIDKGAMEIGGMVSFESKGGDLYKIPEYNAQGLPTGDRTHTIITFQPEALYFVTKGLGVGGMVLFSSDNGSAMADKSTTIGIGPAVRYYFGTAESKFYPFIGGSFAYVSNSYTYDNPPPADFKMTGTSIELTGGAFFKLVDHFGISGALFYDIDNMKSDQPAPLNVSRSGNIIGLKVGITGFLY